MPQVVIFTAPECPHSERLKAFLKSKGIAFEEKCVLTSPETVSELEQVSGQRAIPVTVIDGEAFVGFSRRIERKLTRKLEG